MELKPAIQKFKQMSGVKTAELINLSDGTELIRVEFDGTPYNYIETVESIKETENLIQVEPPRGMKSRSIDKMPVAYYKRNE